MKHRTKQQKMKAQQRRQTMVLNERGEYHFEGLSSNIAAKAEKTATPTAKASDLFAYDVKLIYRDLVRTIILTSLMVVGLVVVAHFL